MSMFDLVIGNSGWPKALMDIMWDVTPEMVGRYRDHWLERDESGDEHALVLAVYARIGGGNREDYTEGIEQMRALTTYLADADDTYDNTYATFRFRLSRTDFKARMIMHEDGKNITEPSLSEVWDELWDQAEHLPRDMAVIWEAMISALPGNFDEKV